MIVEAEVSTDPDNLPARSRLFIVVPKQADAQLVQVSVNFHEHVLNLLIHNLLACTSSQSAIHSMVNSKADLGKSVFFL